MACVSSPNNVTIAVTWNPINQMNTTPLCELEEKQLVMMHNKGTLNLAKRSLHVGGGPFILCWNYALMVGIVPFGECHQNQVWRLRWWLSASQHLGLVMWQVGQQNAIFWPVISQRKRDNLLFQCFFMRFRH